MQKKNLQHLFMIKNSPQTVLREKVLVLSFSCVWIFVTPMDCSTPGFPALHYLPEFAQTHVHWDRDAIQPSHPLLPPSPPALNLSSMSVINVNAVSRLFASGGQSVGASASASVLPVNIQCWFPLGLTVQWTLQESSHSTSYSGGSLNLQNVYIRCKEWLITIVSVGIYKWFAFLIN